MKIVAFVLVVCVIFASVIIYASPVMASSTLAEVVERVRIEAEYFNNEFPEAPPEFAFALSAMNYSKSHISPFVYMHYSDNASKQTEIVGLGYESGMCWVQTMLFIDILNEFGIETRPVQCFHIDENDSSHIFAEVSYNGTWNMFDIAANAYFVDGDNVWDTMSLDEVLHSDNYLDYVMCESSGLYNQMYVQSGKNLYEYLVSDTVEIVYDGLNLPPPQPDTTAPVSGGGGFAPMPGYTNVASKRTPSGMFICDAYCFSGDRKVCLHIGEKNTGKNKSGLSLDIIGIIKKGDFYYITPEGMFFTDTVEIITSNLLFNCFEPAKSYLDYDLKTAWEIYNFTVPYMDKTECKICLSGEV